MLILLVFIFHSTLAVHLLNTTSGIYLGRTVHYREITIRQYLGIEYGRIRTRFARAEPILRQNDSIINATSFGPICKPTINSCTNESDVSPSCSISYGVFALKTSFDEQCLYLNVFLPIIDDKRKSIFMWIHGGSSQIGSGNLFDGTILAALGNLIVITLNYRLNLFGFLSSGDERLKGNIGLHDQSMVLDWIYQNIDALGGDIQRITIGGHSAGAPHAYYLAKSSSNRKRIHRLILQSGCPFNTWSHIKANQAMERFNLVVHDNQCGMMNSFEEKLQCLKDKDFHSIAEHEHYSYTSANHTNVVLYDDLFRNDHTLADMEILIGSNDDEGIYAAMLLILIEQNSQETITLHNVNFREIALKFLAVMQPEKRCLHDKALELYHINKMSENCSQSFDCYCSLFYNYSRLISDVLFYNDYYRFIQHSNRTYLYQYSYPTSQEHPTVCYEYFYNHNLVGHFAELEYTWGTPLLFEKSNLTSLISYLTNTTENYTNEQIEFSREILEQWSNFINYGQPNSTRLGNQWQPISNGSLMHLKLNSSQMKPFHIPSNVQFWMNTCSTNENWNCQELFIEITFILFVIYEYFL